MLIFGHVKAEVYESKGGKLKTKFNWRTLEASELEEFLHAVFLQFGQLYLSRATECISRGLNILRGGAQSNWRGHALSANEKFK